MQGSLAAWGDQGAYGARFGISTFRSFASQVLAPPQAHCASPSDPLDNAELYKFHNAFNPKYDLPMPSYKRWFMLGGFTENGFVGILARRSAMTTYFTLVSHVMSQIEAMEEGEQEELDWARVGEQVKLVWPEVLWSSIREWTTEGIRIFYARTVYDQYGNRLRWKLLKGGTQSALRKLCRASQQGFDAALRVLPQLPKTIARGDALYVAAESTLRALLLPYRLRNVLRNPNNAPLSDVALVVLKHVALEVTTMLTRSSFYAIVATMTVAGTYFCLSSTRWQVTMDDVSQNRDGSDQFPGYAIWLALQAAGQITEAGVMVVRTHVTAALDLEKDPGPYGDVSAIA